MLRIASIDPTVLFPRTPDGHEQLVNVTLNADAAIAEATLTFAFPSLETRICTLTDIPAGESIHAVLLPDVRECVDLAVTLAAGDAADTVTHAWTPRKHWRTHFVPISHHDYGYSGTLEETLAFYDQVYRDVLTFCRATEDWDDDAQFRYTCEAAWSLHHFVEQANDETIAELARYVQQGRVEIPALLGNEISGLCGHEELARLLYPSAKLQRLLGGEIVTGSITDVPGLSWALPTVLSAAGAKYFFAGLPHYWLHEEGGYYTNWDEAACLRDHGVPDAFWWEGPDGSKVLLYYQQGYGPWSPVSVEELETELPKRLDEMDAKGNPFTVARWGGYGCQDNTPPVLTPSELARDWNAKYAYPKYVVSTNAMFFQALEPECDDAPTLRGEMPHTDYAVGALSTAEETILNRETHYLLPAMERFATIATVAHNQLHDPLVDVFGRDLPVSNASFAQHERIEQAYYDMLMYDEHTWGLWSPIGYTQDFCWHEKAAHARRARHITEGVGRRALRRLAESINDESPDRVVIFNPLASERTDIVRVTGTDIAFLPEINSLTPGSEPKTLIDLTTGQAVPHQVVEITSPQDPTHHAASRFALGELFPAKVQELVFKAVDVPSVGYRAYKLVDAEQAPAYETSLVVTETTLENEFFKVTINPDCGAVMSIVDKQLGRELVDGDATHGVNQLITKHTRSDEHNTLRDITVTPGAAGPVMASLVITGSVAGCPQVTQEIVLYDGLKRIDFNTRLLKDSTPLMDVYMAFPLNIDAPEMKFEATGSIMTPFGDDQFAGSNTHYYSVQHWANVSDGQANVTLTPVDAHLVEFGGLWPYYVSHAHRGAIPSDFKQQFVTGEAVTKGHLYSLAMATNFQTNFQPSQCGERVLRYSLTSDGGSLDVAASRDFGWGRMNPMIPVVIHKPVSGDQPPAQSFVSVSESNVVLSALKRADDGDGFILRLMETEGRASSVAIDVPFITIASATETTLIEADVRELTSTSHAVQIDVTPFSVSTIRLRPV